jgi:hypothetical protein
MTPREGFLERLDAVERRLAVLASSPARPGALTEPDPASNERWDPGQVWAHLAEFVAYWTQQLRMVIAAYREEPVPFGRTKTDEQRLAAIERDRTIAVAVLWTQTLSDIESLRSFLETLGSDSWQARGLHPTLGVMPLERIVDDFLVGHLEEHAAQLELLVAVSDV